MIRIKSTLHQDPYMFLVISRSVILRIKNFSDERWGENHKTHFIFTTSLSKIVQFIR